MKNLKKKKKNETEELINLESYIAATTLDWHHFILLPNSSKSPRQHINLTSNRGFVSDESPARVIGEPPPFLRFATTLDTGEFLFPIFSFYSYTLYLRLFKVHVRPVGKFRIEAKGDDTRRRRWWRRRGVRVGWPLRPSTLSRVSDILKISWVRAWWRAGPQSGWPGMPRTSPRSFTSPYAFTTTYPPRVAYRSAIPISCK